MTDRHTDTPLSHVEEVSCELCGGTETFLKWEGPDRALGRTEMWRMVQCVKCGLIFLNPRPTAAAIADHYPTDYYAHGAPVPGVRSKARRQLRTAVLHRYLGYPERPRGVFSVVARVVAPLIRGRWWHVPHYTAHGLALEVGCGSGAVLTFLRELGWETHGVDIDSDAVAVARDGGHQMFEGDLEAAGYPDESFDFVLLSQTLEHLPHPLSAMKEVHRILRPGGEVIVSVPDAGSWIHRAFGEHSFALEMPRHFYMFGRAQLDRLLRDAGFDRVSIRGRWDPYQLLMSIYYATDARRGRPYQSRNPRVWRIHVLLERIASALFQLLGLSNTLVVRCREQSRHHRKGDSESIHASSDRRHSRSE